MAAQVLPSVRLLVDLGYCLTYIYGGVNVGVLPWAGEAAAGQDVAHQELQLLQGWEGAFKVPLHHSQ